VSLTATCGEPGPPGREGAGRLERGDDPRGGGWIRAGAKG
jgi:hypothetical protein